jgi:plasmid stabilization system protein ParE
VRRLGLKFAPGAAEQLRDANDWWKLNRPESANLLATEFNAAIDLLRDAPGLGAPYPNDALSGARRFFMRKSRFHIYYVLAEHTLIVAAVWSARRGHGPFAA